MSRHPYTYAADALRQFASAESFPFSCSLSRAQSSKIREYIAETLGMSDEELAIKLSERYQTEKPTP